MKQTIRVFYPGSVNQYRFTALARIARRRGYGQYLGYVENRHGTWIHFGRRGMLP